MDFPNDAKTADSSTYTCQHHPKKLSHGQKRQSSNQRYESLDQSADSIIMIREALENVPKHKYIEEILRHFLMPEEDLEKIINMVMTDLGYTLKRDFNIFGSSFTGLCLKSSDLDIFTKIFPHENKLIFTLKTMSKCLSKSRHFGKVFPILHAKVPIIKCVHLKTNTSLDISGSNLEGIANSYFVRDILNQRPRMRQLITLAKIWYKQQNLQKANLSCHCFIMMVFFYLQQGVQTSEGTIKLFPSIQSLQKDCPPYWIRWANCTYDLRRLNPWPQNIEVVDVLKGFFQFYSELDFESVILSLYLGKSLPKANFAQHLDFYEYEMILEKLNREKPDREDICLQTTTCMCLQDPFFLNLNLTKGINRKNFNRVKRAFDLAKTICLEHPNPPNLYLSLLSISNKSENTLEHHEEMKMILNPSGRDFKTLQKLVPEKEIFNVWSNYYVKAFERLLVEVFGCELNKCDINQESKKPKMKDDFSIMTWKIKASLDLWTNRWLKDLPDSNVFEYLMSQTATMKSERVNEPKYAITMQGSVDISIRYERQCLEINVKAKQSPAREKNFIKFFNFLKTATNSIRINEFMEEKENSQLGEAGSKKENVQTMEGAVIL